MRVWLAIAAGLLLLAIAALAQAPATLVDWRVASLSAGRVRIADAAGTVWNGSGDLVLLPSGARRSLRWRIEPWPLAWGEVRGTLTSDASGGAPAEFDYGRRRAELRRFDMTLPVASLLLAGGVPATLAGAGGDLDAHVERFAQTPDALDAAFTLRWRAATLSTMVPGASVGLGDVQLDLRGTGREIEGTLANRGGDVEIAGRVALTANLALKLDATVRPRAGIDRDRAQAIAAALALIGSSDGEGGYRIAWQRS